MNNLSLLPPPRWDRCHWGSVGCRGGLTLMKLCKWLTGMFWLRYWWVYWHLTSVFMV